MSKKMDEQLKELFLRLTDSIRKAVKEGIDWRKPYLADGRMPSNPLNGRGAFTGMVNNFILVLSGYTSPQWATFNQIKKAGGRVKKGEKATTVFFPRMATVKDKETGEKKSVMIGFGVYNVFNLAAQTEGMEKYLTELNAGVLTDADRLENCEAIAKAFFERKGAPKLKTVPGTIPCHVPGQNEIRMPPIEAFDGIGEYYSCLFHEMAHAAGTVGRADNKGKDRHLEEGMAECTASIVCAQVGIDNTTLDNSAAYIAHWNGAIMKDPTILADIWSASQKRARYIMQSAAVNEKENIKQAA